MNTRFRFMLLAALLVVCLPLSAHVDWQFLGQRVVNDRADRDTLHIGRGEGRFTALRLQVDGAPVQVRRVVVVFADGQRQRVERDLWIGEDRRSPVLDLSGGARFVDHVVLHYEARSPGFERASVKLYGRR